MSCSVLKCAAVCCSVLQCVAVCCSALHLQNWEVYDSPTDHVACRTPWRLIPLSLSFSLPPPSFSFLSLSLVHSLSLSRSLSFSLTRTDGEEVATRHHTAMQHTATHCNTLQHTVTHCNALQQTHCNIADSERNIAGHLEVAKQVLHCFRGLQCCSAFVAAFCSVLQCVAVCCSVLQCVAVCCSVLQCIAIAATTWRP